MTATDLIENPWARDHAPEVLTLGKSLIGLTLREASLKTRVREVMVNGREYSVPDDVKETFFNVETRAGLIVRIISIK